MVKRFRIPKGAKGKTPMTSLRVSEEMQEAILQWAAKQEGKPGYSEAIRRLTALALEAEAAKKKGRGK